MRSRRSVGGAWAECSLHSFHPRRTPLMKAMWSVVIVGLALSAPAQAQITNDESARAQEAAEVVVAMRDAPDKGIPEELWEKANCAIVIPGLKKAAFGI